MARIRSMKPEFRTSLTVTSWPRDVRLFFALLWGYLDDEGRGIDEPRLIKADCFPLDDDITPAIVDGWLDLMGQSGTVVRYEVAGRRYLAVPSWREHQKPQHPTRSRHPQPPAPDGAPGPGEPSPDTGNGRSAPPEKPHEPLTKPRESLTPEGEGSREQGGGAREVVPLVSATPSRSAPEPPLKCERHTHTRNPPNCGSCADARREHQAWQRRQVTPTPRAPDCPHHPGHPAGRCDRCSAEAVPSPGLRAARSA